MTRIPDRWLEYSSIGKSIYGTRLICFKTPLKSTYYVANPGVEIWSIAKLVKRVPNLGLVIDLTFTTKYYDPEELTNLGIEHKKILCEGHVIPKNHVVNEFIKTVEEFISKNRCNDKLIGVHCTHGLNRTGYLVCRYMIESLDICPRVAIEEFNKARGHDMERKNYLHDLLSFEDIQ